MSRADTYFSLFEMPQLWYFKGKTGAMDALIIRDFSSEPMKKKVSEQPAPLFIIGQEIPETERSEAEQRPDPELLAFEKVNKCGYPIRYIVRGVDWEVRDLLSGELLSSIPRDKAVDTFVLLDGDHFLTGEGVYSIPDSKKTQDPDDVVSFFGTRYGYNWYFETLPHHGKSKYIPSHHSMGVTVFDIHSKQKILVGFVDDSSKLRVWRWNNEKYSGATLERLWDHTFEGADWIAAHGVYGQSDVILGHKKTLVIYDASIGKVRRTVKMEPEDWSVFALPNGDLGVLIDKDGKKSLVNFSRFIETNRDSFTEGDVAKFSLLTYDGTFGGSLIFSDPKCLGTDHLIVILKKGKELWLMRSFDESLLQIGIERGETPSDEAVRSDGTEDAEKRAPGSVLLEKGETLCGFLLGESHIGLFHGSQVRIVDYLTGEVKQTLRIPGIRGHFSAKEFDGGFYFIRTEKGGHLFEYSPKENKYKLRRVVEGNDIVFLPASTKQKRALAAKLDEIVTAIPQAVTRVIASFI